MYLELTNEERNPILLPGLHFIASFVSPNPEKIELTKTTQTPPFSIHFEPQRIYMGKCRTAGVQLENHVSGIRTTRSIPSYYTNHRLPESSCR